MSVEVSMEQKLVSVAQRAAYLSLSDSMVGSLFIV